MRPARWCALAALAAWLACGPVAPPSEATYVENGCPCAAYQQPAPLPPPVCSHGTCVSNSAFDPLLVISLPDSSRYYPGITMAVQRSALASPDTTACHGPCVQLPPPAGDTGFLVVTDAVAAAPGIRVDLGNASGSAAIPVSSLYYPLAQITADAGAAGGTPLYVESQLAGIPLLPSRALVDTASVTGPQGSAGYGWRISLGRGVYERDIVPTDDRFPPLISTVTIDRPVPQEYAISAVDGASVPGSHLLTLTWPEQDLRGFRAFLRDVTTQRRVSSLVTITDSAPGPITLNTFQSLSGAKLEKVLQPLAGAPIPEFADPLPPTAQIGTAVVPRLPVPITVSGDVETADHTPIEAELLFDSTPFTVSGGGIEIVPTNDTNRDSGRRALRYSTSVRTSSSGRYEVQLPPGQYDVFVAPADTSVAAVASAVVSVPAQTSGFVARGQTRYAGTFATVRGVVRLADGRPLPGAEVEVRPGAADVATVDPRRWPRVRSTTTAADGSYSLLVDPGTLDLIVRPVEGTGFPVTTRSGIVADATKAAEVDPVVPAPIAIDLVLHDPADNPVAGALVRAFAASATPSTLPTTVPRAALEIGRWITDGAGHMTMLVVPPP